MLVETNPNVIEFCEQPFRINEVYEGERIQFIPDMWIRWKDGRQTIVEVKYSKSHWSNCKQYLTTKRQIEIQKHWCKCNGFEHSVQTEEEIRGNPIYLENMRELLTSITNHPNPFDTDDHQIFKSLSYEPISIGAIQQLNPHITVQRIKESIYRQIYHGAIQSNVNKLLLCLDTEVWKIG